MFSVSVTQILRLNQDSNIFWGSNLLFIITRVGLILIFNLIVSLTHSTPSPVFYRVWVISAAVSEASVDQVSSYLQPERVRGTVTSGASCSSVLQVCAPLPPSLLLC